MSTFTAIGPALSLDGPLPVPPEYRLLALPGVAQAADRELNGVNVWGYPEDTPSLWEPCSTGTFRVKGEDSEWQQPRFDPFVAYLPISCSTISARPEVFAARAERVFEATLSFAVEQALARGVDGSSNPFFGDTNLVQLGGGVVSAQAGLNYLENAIGATGRGGVIHATPGTVSAWNFVNLITDNGEGYIETANGTPVVSGGGYIDTDPSGLAVSDPSVGLEWAFATGPVRVYLADAALVEVSEYVDRDDNIITYRAERYVVAVWDTSLQSGVLIDWTP
jgi:hypothetical protein